MTAILLAVPLVCLLFEPERLFTSYTASLTTYGIIAGMFLAMSTAAGEKSRGTMPFLQSLPVPMWRPAWAKLVSAAVTDVLPLVVTALAILLIYLLFPGYWQDHEQTYGRSSVRVADGRIWERLGVRLACSALGVGSLLVWDAASGVNRQDEM